MASAGQLSRPASNKVPLEASEQFKDQHDFYGTIGGDDGVFVLADDDRDDLRLLAPVSVSHLKGHPVHVRGIVGSCGTLLAWSIQPA